MTTEFDGALAPQMTNAALLPGACERAISAVSWAAILAGAAAATAASLVLLALGSGLGFGVVGSPAVFGVMSAIWLIIMQWVSSALGGYLTGRLRTRWIGTHTHEVFFRDTAHGFLAWAVATLVVAALIGSAAATVTGAGVRVAADRRAPTTTRAIGAPTEALPSPAIAYDVDRLFRSGRPDQSPAAADARLEAARILAARPVDETLPAEDALYLVQLTSDYAGISPVSAQERLDTVLGRERAAEANLEATADTARKTAAGLAIFTALAMVIGALIASVAAALGGQLRDQHP